MSEEYSNALDEHVDSGHYITVDKHPNMPGYTRAKAMVLCPGEPDDTCMIEAHGDGVDDAINKLHEALYRRAGK